MISLREYIQSYLDSVYASEFLSLPGSLPPLSEVMKTVYTAAIAYGLNRSQVIGKSVDVSELSLPDHKSYRVLFAHLASYYVDNGDRSYLSPDLPSGSSPVEVPVSVILPPEPERSILLSTPVRFVPIHLPTLEAS